MDGTPALKIDTDSTLKHLRCEMSSKLLRKLVVCLAAAGMAAGLCTVPVLASSGGYSVTGLSMEGAKLTHAQLEFYDNAGVIMGTCYAASAVVAKGSASLSCDFSGPAEAAEIATLTSDRHKETFAVAGVGKHAIALESIDGGKTGWFAVDLGGNLPTF